MINKYAEIYKRAQLYKAARGILRTKLAVYYTASELAGLSTQELANLTTQPGAKFAPEAQALINKQMPAINSFINSHSTTASLPSSPAANATGQTAVNATGQTAANATGQTAANGGLTQEQKLINRLKRQNKMHAGKASEYYKQLMKTRWGLGLTAAGLAIPAAYGAYKFFGGGQQPQPQQVPYMQQQGYQYFNSPNAF